MDYGFVQNLSAKKFRRLTGIQPETFSEMVKILKNTDEQRRETHKYRGGRPPALSI